MSAANKSVRLLTVEIRIEQDVVLARQRARQLTAALGFEPQLQTRIATALSEIARNAFEYGGGGRAEFAVLTEPHPSGQNRLRQSLVIKVADNGPGIANLELILAGKYRSASGLGLGIIGAQRLMDRLDIENSPKGAAITLVKVFSPAIPPRTAVQLQAIVDELARQPPAGPLEEIQIQNQELVRAMEESRLREEELARVNQELAETNTGVLALYDELETLHRISVMLASKLELRPLIQSIIDVTTTLTDADVGVFYFRDERTERWTTYAISGPKAPPLSDFPANLDADLFGAGFAEAGMVHIADLEAQPELDVCKCVGVALQGFLQVRSCFAVPVVENNQVLLGALAFVSGKPNAFSERIERILTSVATQAVVGIEKARLFQSVTAASDAKDQFLAMISHELRTPLNPAMAIISSLQRDPRVPPDLREEIDVVWRNIRLEARLIDDLLDFNRLIKGKMQLAVDILDMHAVIESVVAICREDLELKRHQLTVELTARRHTVSGDAPRLQQVLWNVLKNAIKFTPEDGLITIRTTSEGSTLQIEIVDNGRGIEASAMERIFSAFDQGQPHLAAHFGGLGLGLSIARMFIDLHGGKISASSSGLGRGATIGIGLPLIDSAMPPAAPARIPSAVTISDTGRILLVDDHTDTLSTLARLLRRRGFEVVPAANAAEARVSANEGKFDLLISDLGLPDCSGLELVEQIRKIQPMPAIALSGYGMERDVAGSKKAGFQRHLTKPIDFEELTRAIQALLGGEGTEPAGE